MPSPWVRRQQQSMDAIEPGAVCPVCREGTLASDSDDTRLIVCDDCGAVPTGIDALLTMDDDDIATTHPINFLTEAESEEYFA